MECPEELVVLWEDTGSDESVASGSEVVELDVELPEGVEATGVEFDGVELF